MFFSKKLSQFKNIRHGFFSRKNGFSSGLYESLNCGIGSNDTKENIIKNINYVSKKIGCKKENLITLKQLHSNKVLCFKNNNSIENKLPGDAIVTEIKNIAIGILAADCAPILLYDPKREIIGCIHSGWKGALNGIVKNTINQFQDLNTNCRDLIAVIGPCISKNNYVVKNDFYEKFISQNPLNSKFFEKIEDGNYLFDLRGFINDELLSLNVKNIENVNVDTFSQSENFFSYRRSIVKGEKDYGRCISVILMS